MKFKVDENLPEEVVSELQAAGHEATSVHLQRMSGVDDKTISQRVVQEERCLITLDLGFGDIRAYPPSNFKGIIVLRTKIQDKFTTLSLVRSFMPKLVTENVSGQLWIVEEDRIRIRGEAE